jgi:hypothetical protein
VTLTGAGISGAQQAAVAPSPTGLPAVTPTPRPAAAPAAPTPVSIGAPQASGASTGPSGGIPDPGGAAPTNTPIPPTAVVAASAGIELGKPVAFVSGPVTTVGLPVKNTGSTIKSFDVKVSYGGGAVATGRVEDVAPGQTRVATLISMDQVPANPASIKVDLEGVTERASSPATKVTFGTPQLRSQNGVAQLVVDVTNGDAAAHSVYIAAGFYKDADLVGLARGGVDALAPGQTRSATLLVYGDAGGPIGTTRSATTGVPPYDRIEVGLGGLTN